MIDRPDATTSAELARLYDLDLEDDPGDLDLYLALAGRADGPVLELAAGTGRLTVPLAAAGHDVTAVDIDPAMLERGRERARVAGVSATRIEWVEADLCDLRLPRAGRHALAFLALNSIMLLGHARCSTGGVPDPPRAPRAGRDRGGRCLAPGRGGPRPVRRADHPRVAAHRSAPRAGS